MLNTNSFSFPSLKKFDFFGLKSYPLPSLKANEPINRRSTNTIEVKREKQFSKAPTGTCTQGTARYNNMCQEVMWFHQQNKHEALLKIMAIFCICLGLYLLGVCEIQSFICLIIISTFLFGRKHGLFGRLRRWAQLSLLGSTFVLANQIFISTLTIISSQTADILVSRYFTLIPAMLITVLVVVHYIYSPLTMNPFQVCQRSLRGSLLNYPLNLIQVAKKVYSIKYQLILSYLAGFLVLYAVVCLLQLDQILASGFAYIELLDPYVFLAQFLTFLWMVIVHHAILQFVDELVLWHFSITALFGKVNEYTKIPTILELLKVVPTQQAERQLEKKGLTRFFKVFSLEQSKLQNGLNRTKLENIYRHSLAFLIKYLERCNTLRHKIHIYSLPSPNSSSFEPRTYTTYENIFLQFSTEELERCLDKMYSLCQLIDNLHIQKINKKSPYEDLFYYFRMQLSEICLHGKLLECTKYLQLTDYILEILLINGLGSPSNITAKIEKLKQITSKMEGVFWLNSAIQQRMGAISKKTSKILGKLER